MPSSKKSFSTVPSLTWTGQGKITNNGRKKHTFAAFSVLLLLLVVMSSHSDKRNETLERTRKGQGMYGLGRVSTVPSSTCPTCGRAQSPTDDRLRLLNTHQSSDYTKTAQQHRSSSGAYRQRGSAWQNKTSIDRTLPRAKQQHQRTAHPTTTTHHHHTARNHKQAKLAAPTPRQAMK